MQTRELAFRRQAIGLDVQSVWRKERVIRILLIVIYKLVIAFRYVRHGQGEKRVRSPDPRTVRTLGLQSPTSSHIS
jgi:hypothetical protein